MSSILSQSLSMLISDESDRREREDYDLLSWMSFFSSTSVSSVKVLFFGKFFGASCSSSVVTSIELCASSCASSYPPVSVGVDEQKLSD